MRVPEPWHRASMAFLGIVKEALKDETLDCETKLAYIKLALRDLEKVAHKEKVYG